MANFTLDQTGQEIQDILDIVGNNQATQGQVLTADGSGGANWQNASGGSDKYYEHNFKFDDNTYYVFIDIFNQSETFTLNTLKQWLIDNGYTSSNNAYTSNFNKLSVNTLSNKLQVTTSIYYDSSYNGIRFNYRTYTFSIVDNAISISSASNTVTPNALTDTVEEL